MIKQKLKFSGEKAAITKRRKAGAKEAWKTIRSSERHFLKKIKSKKEDCILHGSGMPDIFIKTGSGIEFFEIKPGKGSEKQKKLNSRQVNAIYHILSWGIGKVYLVQYEKNNKEYCYHEKHQLTLENLPDY